MDPVTHVLAAAAAAEVFTPAALEPWAVAAAVGGGLAPDLDFAARPLGHLGLLKFHHTATHSAAGAAVLAMGWAGLLSFISHLPWLSLLPFALLGVVTHLGLDILLHNNGLMLAWPFSRRMVRGGWFLGLNPATSSARCGERKLSVCLVCQAHSVVFNRVFFILVATAAGAGVLWPWRRWAAAAGVAVLAAYVTYVFVLKARARALARRTLGPRAEVFPASFGGGSWLAVAPAAGGYVTAAVDVRKGAVGDPRGHAPAPDEVRRATESRPAVQAFLANAIFPFTALGPGGHGVWWQDLSYAFSPTVQLHTLKLTQDEDGNVVGEEFRERW